MKHFFLVMALLASGALAAQAEPQLAVHEPSRECAEFFMGDECTTCTLPEGWEIVNECPEGYREVDERSDCTPRKDNFCCTFGHSGSNGDCDDVVVDELNKQCGFVENITECASLPMGWKSPSASQAYGRLCPSIEYTWVNGPVECEKKSVQVIEDEDNQKRRETEKNQYVWMVVALVLLICSIIWIIYVIKLKNYSSI